MVEALIGAAKSLVYVVTPLNLAVLSFIEAIFFPIPPDALLIPLVLLRPEEGLVYALIATFFSVFGACLGYVLGKRGGRPILNRIIPEARFNQAEQLFARYDVWAIAIAGFTPVPYKVFAIAAGVFAIDWWRFVVVSLLSRGKRFGLIALLLMYFGSQMAEFIQRHFGWLTVGLMAALIGGFWFYRSVVKGRLIQ